MTTNRVAQRIEDEAAQLRRRRASDRVGLHLPDGFVAPDLLHALDAVPPPSGLGLEGLVATIGSASASLDERLRAGAVMGIVGDPRLCVEDPAMVTVAGGTFDMGLDREAVDDVCARWAHVGVARGWIEKEVPVHEVAVETFRIGRFPVTTMEYRVFLEDTRRTPPQSWRLGAYPWWVSNHPVHGVSVEDARAYAEWLAARTGRRFRLPTEAEWELAATGGDRRAFPWGDDFDSTRLNTLEGGPLTTTPVGSYPNGAAACGALDLAGNVEEWVDTSYTPYPGGRVIKDDLWDLDPIYTVARGGSHARFGDLARCRRRHGYFPRDLYVIGFRLVEEAHRWR